MKYYCLHHLPEIARKQYLIDLFEKQEIQVEWIEDFLPDHPVVVNHIPIHSEHSADGNGILNNAEISLILKHILFLEKLSKTNDYGIVFEDDIQEFNFNLADTVPILINKMNQINGEILWIGSILSLDMMPRDTIEVISRKDTTSRASHCYMLHSDIAKKVWEYYREIKHPADWQWNDTIEHLNLKSCWSYPHINQRTNLGLIKSCITNKR